MRDVSIRVRIVASVLLVLAVGALLIAALLQRDHNRVVDDAARDALDASRVGFELVREGRTEKLFALLDALTSDAEITKAFASRDRKALADLTGDRYRWLSSRQGLTRWYFYLPEDEATVFLRSYREDAALDESEYGDEVTRETYWQSVESKEQVSGFELGRSAVALRCVTPHHDGSGDLIGYMAVGEEIGDFLELVSQRTGDEYALFLKKRAFDQDVWSSSRTQSGLRDNWNDHPLVVLADTTRGETGEPGFDVDIPDIPEEGLVLDTVVEGDRIFVHGVFPIAEAGGRKVAAVQVSRDITDTVARIRSTQTLVLMLVGLVIMGVAIVILMTLNRLIFRRLNLMIEQMEDLGLRVAGGDFRIPPMQPQSRDEIGEFQRFFVDFVSLVAVALRSVRDEHKDS